MTELEYAGSELEGKGIYAQLLISLLAPPRGHFQTATREQCSLFWT